MGANAQRFGGVREEGQRGRETESWQVMDKRWRGRPRETQDRGGWSENWGRDHEENRVQGALWAPLEKSRVSSLQAGAAPRSSLRSDSRMPSKEVCTCSQTPPIQALSLPKSREPGQPQAPG